MRLTTFQLNLPANGATGPGAPHPIGDYKSMALQFVGGSGSWDIECSLNGVDFVKAHTVTAPGIYTVDYPCTHIRVNATSNATAPKVYVGGYIG